MFKLKYSIWTLLFILAGTLWLQPKDVGGITWQDPFIERAPSAVGENCLTCHEGIEEINQHHPLELGCTVCHGGDGSAIHKEEAHTGLIFESASGTGRKNPSTFGVVEQTCGRASCHSSHGGQEPDPVSRMKKSIMSTMAGIISGLRYQWGAQPDSRSIYALESIRDEDGDIPRHQGAVEGFKELPYFTMADFLKSGDTSALSEETISKHIGDRLLRQSCSQCHLNSPPGPGQNRSVGCAACHFVHSEKGAYEGDDPTISKETSGHSALHKITALPPDSVCLQCHQRFKMKNAQQFPESGKPVQDVHTAVGMECIDCHTQSDIMGDGNLYSKQYQAVEIRCETCHGSGDSPPTKGEIIHPEDPAIRASRYYNGFDNQIGDILAMTTRQRKMTNIKQIDDDWFAFTKRKGNMLMIPQTAKTPIAHSIPEHSSRLECAACHSQWAPKCTACHTTFNQQASKKNAQKKAWSQGDFSFEPVPPALMIGPRGKVAPMLPFTEKNLTAIDEEGHFFPVLDRYKDSLGDYKQWHFTNPKGYSGSKPVYAFSPHSVGTRARACEDCHSNPKTLGLGEGNLIIGRNSSGKRDTIKPLDRSDIVRKHSKYSPETRVTPQGLPLAESHQKGARLFNQEELTRILKVGTCLPCHKGYNDPIYQNIQKSYRFEKLAKHRQLRSTVLDKLKQ